jgi:hypothetical protein
MPVYTRISHIIIGKGKHHEAMETMPSTVGGAVTHVMDFLDDVEYTGQTVTLFHRDTEWTEESMFSEMCALVSLNLSTRHANQLYIRREPRYNVIKYQVDGTVEGRSNDAPAIREFEALCYEIVIIRDEYDSPSCHIMMFMDPSCATTWGINALQYPYEYIGKKTCLDTDAAAWRLISPILSSQKVCYRYHRLLDGGVIQAMMQEFCNLRTGSRKNRFARFHIDIVDDIWHTTTHLYYNQIAYWILRTLQNFTPEVSLYRKSTGGLALDYMCLLNGSNSFMHFQASDFQGTQIEGHGHTLKQVLVSVAVFYIATSSAHSRIISDGYQHVSTLQADELMRTWETKIQNNYRMARYTKAILDVQSSRSGAVKTKSARNKLSGLPEETARQVLQSLQKLNNIA